MTEPINQIQENIRSKWWRGFIWGFLSAALLFFGSIIKFPSWYEKILKEDYVPIEKYESLKKSKDSQNENSHGTSPKNSNTQIGDSNENTQN
jgi:hypothetical protein